MQRQHTHTHTYASLEGRCSLEEVCGNCKERGAEESRIEQGQVQAISSHYEFFWLE